MDNLIPGGGGTVIRFADIQISCLVMVIQVLSRLRRIFTLFGGGFLRLSSFCLVFLFILHFFSFLNLSDVRKGLCLPTYLVLVNNLNALII